MACPEFSDPPAVIRCFSGHSAKKASMEPDRICSIPRGSLSRYVVRVARTFYRAGIRSSPLTRDDHAPPVIVSGSGPENRTLLIRLMRPTCPPGHQPATMTAKPHRHPLAAHHGLPCPPRFPSAVYH